MTNNWFIKLLDSFDYSCLTSLLESVAPSMRYGISRMLLCISLTIPGTAWLQAFLPSVPVALGIQTGACISLVVAFAVELISGIWASQIRKEQFSSFRLSRFGFKVCIYLVLIAIPYQFSRNYANDGDVVMAFTFKWLQNFLIIHISLENIVSILENLSVIDGKDKTAWINTIKAKLTGRL